jgi:hypothetical protein
VWKSKFYGAFVLNHHVVLHAIEATPARWRGDAGSLFLDGARGAASSPGNDFVKNCRVHPTHWLISTQLFAVLGISVPLATRREWALSFARVAGAARDAFLSRLFPAYRFIVGP